MFVFDRCCVGLMYYKVELECLINVRPRIVAILLDGLYDRIVAAVFDGY